MRQLFWVRTCWFVWCGWLFANSPVPGNLVVVKFRNCQRSRGRLVFWLGTLVCLLLNVTPTQAHSPFQSNTRMIVSESAMEIALTVGMDGGQTLLQGAPPEALTVRTVGPSCVLPVEFGARWFELTADGRVLSPDKVEARTDGLEFNLVVKYPRPGGRAVVVDAVYLAKLPSSIKSVFVMTDEPGNILAARALSVGNHAFEVALPTPAAGLETNLSVSSPAVLAAATVLPANHARPLMPVAAASPVNPTLGFGDFLKLGIEHILTGYDHLLFLCGLLVMCRKTGPMLAIITCFTLSHSVTLALSALGWVQISARLTEPLIAATIVFVGIENFRGAVNTKTRCGLALGFGLIHGFGFATALRAAGLAGTGLALAKPLLAFNLGVEAGQLAVAAVFLPLLFALRRVPLFERYGPVTVSGTVVLLGGFWLVQRVVYP